MPSKTQSQFQSVEPWIVAGLILFILGLRLFALTADAPHFISGIGTALDDPYWAQNARSKVLFGSWAPDDARALALAPFTNFLSYLSFAILGVGFAQFHLPNVILSVLTAFLTYTVIRRQYGSASAILGLVLIGMCYVFIMHNRMGRPETINAFLMTLSLFAWQRFSYTRKPLWAFAFGLLWLLPPIGKLNDFYWVGVVAGMIFLAATALRGANRLDLINLKSGAAFLGGSLLIVAVVSVWLIPNFSYYFHAITGFGNRVLGGFATTTLHLYFVIFQNTFFLRMPLVIVFFMLGCVCLFVEIRRAVKNRELEKVDSVAVFCMLWISFQLASLPLYHVEAYRFVTLVPPMVILSGKAIQWILQGSSTGAMATLFDWGNRHLLVFWMFPTGFLLSAQIFSASVGMRWFWLITPSSLLESVGVSLLGGVVAAVLAVFGRRLFFAHDADCARLLNGARVPIIGVLISLSVMVDLGQYLHWALNRTYSQYEASRSLRVLGEEHVVGGWAYSLDLENRIKPIFLEDRMGMTYSAVAKMKDVKYLLVGLSEELGMTSIDKPTQQLLELRHAHATRSLAVREYTVHLYKVDD